MYSLVLNVIIKKIHFCVSGAPLVSANTGGLIGIAVGVNPDCANPQGFIGVSAYTQWIERVIDEVMCMKEIVKRKFQ